MTDSTLTPPRLVMRLRKGLPRAWGQLLPSGPVPPRVSPLAPLPGQPGPDHAPRAVPGHAPVARAGQGVHQVQAVRAGGVTGPAAPQAAAVLHLDPAGRAAQRAADREELPATA